MFLNEGRFVDPNSFRRTTLASWIEQIRHICNFSFFTKRMMITTKWFSSSALYITISFFLFSGVECLISTFWVPTTLCSVPKVTWFGRYRPSSFALASTSSTVNPSLDDATTSDILICGGGPSGLLAAIMLSQKFPKVRPSTTLH